MSNLIRSLFHLGKLVNPPTTESVSGVYTLEITSEQPGFALAAKDAQFIVPRHRERGSNILPNHGYDNLKYIFGTEDPRKREAFWKQILIDTRAIGDPAIAATVEKASQALSKWKLEEAGQVGKTNFWFVNDSSGKRAVVHGEASKGVPKGAIPDNTWIVFLVKGKPITAMPSFSDWWAKESADQKPDKGGTTGFDLVTGLPCVPVRLHPRVSSVPNAGGPSPLLSYDKETFRYRGEKQGLNFPMDPSTARLVAAGLSYLLDRKNGFSAIFGDTALAIWPREGLSHPVAPLAIKLLNGFIPQDEARETWDRLKGVQADGCINLLQIKGSQRRIAPLHFEEIEAADLRQNMLGFREEFTPFRMGDYQPLLRDVVRVPENERPIVPEHHAPAIAWAVVTGTKFPVQLGVSLAQYPKREIQATSWVTAYNHRNEDMSMTRTVCKPEIMTYKNQSVMVRMDDVDAYTDPALETQEAYVYGLLLASHVGLKRAYHIRDQGKADPGATLRLGLRSPRLFLASARAAQSWIYTKTISDKMFNYRVLDSRHGELDAKLGSWSPNRLDPGQNRMVQIGFRDQYRYIQDFFAFHRQTNQKLIAEMQKEGLLDDLRGVSSGQAG